MSNKKYSEYSLPTLWAMLSYLENLIRVYNGIQDKIKYFVEKGKLTSSEVAPLVTKTTNAFALIDEQTILIEKALDLKMRKASGLRDLSTSAVRFSKELQDLLDSRAEKEKENDSANVPKLDLS